MSDRMGAGSSTALQQQASPHGCQHGAAVVAAHGLVLLPVLLSLVGPPPMRRGGAPGPKQ